jgi:hypothetical protein
MTRRAFERVLFGVVVAAGLVYESTVLFWPSSTLRAAGVKPYVINDLAKGDRVGQTFRSPEDDVDAVDVELSTERAAEIDLTFRLLGWTPSKPDDQWLPIYESREIIRLPNGTSWHHFAFRPLLRSEKQIYQWQLQQNGVRSRDDNPAPPTVGVVASDDGALTDGNVVISGLQLPDRDLMYAAYTANEFDRFRIRANPNLPRPVRAASVQLSLLALYNVAVIVFAYELLHGRREKCGADASAVSV